MKFLLAFLGTFLLFHQTEACDAYTYNQLINCVANNTTIYLKADITLYPNQNIRIDGISNLIINGLDGTIKHFIDETTDRFVNQTGNTPYYISIFNSSNITVENIFFKSTPASDSECAHDDSHINKYNTAACYGDVAAINSNNIQINSNEFTSQKTFQTQIQNVNGFHIENNTFKNASTYGLWINTTIQNTTQNFQIVSNNFQNSGANALFLAGANNGWIGNNIFLNNHRLNQYSNFGGGQVLFESSQVNSEHLSITGNTITGNLTNVSHGIEFSNFSGNGRLTNVDVMWNRIVGNQQSAIRFNDSQSNSKLDGIRISNNEFIENNSPFKSQTITTAFGGLEIFNNTIQKNGQIISASFLDTPKSCTLENGQDRCSVNIKWSATTGINPYITVRSVTQQVGNESRGLFSTGVLSGSQNAAWIDKTGVIFELYDKTDYDQSFGWKGPIASIVIKAIN